MLKPNLDFVRARRGGGALLIALVFALGACGGESQQNDGAGRPSVPPREPVSLVRNPGFETREGGGAANWTRDEAATGGKGEVDLIRGAYAGDLALRLSPNNRNDPDQPLAVSQLIDAGEFRGETLEYGGVVRSEGGAIASVAVLSIVGGTPQKFELVSHDGGEWTEISGSYTVPDAPGVQLALIAMVNGKSGAADFDELHLGVRRAPDVVADPGEPLRASMSIDASRVTKEIPPEMFGANIEWRWNATWGWDEERQRIDPTLTRLADEMGVQLIRYPGGVYSDYYHWRDGVGPYDERPIVKHEPGKEDASRPNFGTDEVLAWAERIGARVMITVNAGTGTAEEAADWVRYVNRDELRVELWEVGNELYIDDGSVFASAVAMTPERYAEVFEEFADAMREADPRIKVGAIGGENQLRYSIVSDPDWNRTVLQRVGSKIDFLSVHNAYAPIVLDDTRPVREVYRAMFAAPKLLERNLDTLAEQVERFAGGRDIPIAVTEWGPFFQVDFGSRYVDHNKTMGSAVFVGSQFQTLIEHPATSLAAFWMLHDISVLGWIGSESRAYPVEPEWAPTARYHVFQLFSRHFGSKLVGYGIESPTFDSAAVGFIAAVENVEYLDAIASLSDDGDTLYVIAVNKHFDRPMTVDFDISGFSAGAEGVARAVTGSGIDAHTGTYLIDLPVFGLAEQARDEVNPRMHRGGRDEIRVTESGIPVGNTFTHTLPPHSVTAIRIGAR